MGSTTLSLSQPKKGLRPQSTCHSSQLDSLTLNLTSCLASPSTSSTRLLPSRSACTRRSASCRAPTRTSWTSSALVRPLSSSPVTRRNLETDFESRTDRLLQHHDRLLARPDRRPLRLVLDRPVPAHRRQG